MARKQSQNYPARLAKPSVAETKEEEFEQKRQLLSLLFRHYGIDPKAPDLWAQLSLSLAERHVPAFSFFSKAASPFSRNLPAPRQPGKPKRWTLDAEITLYVEVSKRVQSGQSVSDACRELVRSREFKKRFGTPERPPKPETLRRRYQALKKSAAFRKLLRDGRFPW